MFYGVNFILLIASLVRIVHLERCVYTMLCKVLKSFDCCVRFYSVALQTYLMAWMCAAWLFCQCADSSLSSQPSHDARRPNALVWLRCSACEPCREQADPSGLWACKRSGRVTGNPSEIESTGKLARRSRAESISVRSELSWAQRSVQL